MTKKRKQKAKENRIQKSVHGMKNPDGQRLIEREQRVLEIKRREG